MAISGLVIAFAALVACEPVPPPFVTIPASDAVVAWAARRVAAALPLERLGGQLIMVGVENDADGLPLVRLNDEMRDLLRDVQPGAAVLFGRTFASVPQVQALVGEIEDAIAVPPLLATDYEGGRVSRLTTTGGIPATRIPAAAVVGRAVANASATAPPDATPEREASPGLTLARELGRVMGRELRVLGITMNFAPVADVNPSEGTGAMGRDGRSFGADPRVVGEIAAAVTAGLEASGVAAVVKHFPGHGGVTADSHEELAVLQASAGTLRARDLFAFALALEAEPTGLMTGHLAAPALEAEAPGVDAKDAASGPAGETSPSPAAYRGLTPASISPAIGVIVRRELGFGGLVITDALNMRALTELAPEPELVVRAVEAGADLVMKPLDARGARDALIAAVREGRISRARLEESVARIFYAKARLGIFGPAARWREPLSVEAAEAVLGSAEHRATVGLIEELAGGGS